MLYHTQELLHKENTYPSGSCYPTVYACILDLPLNQVPYFNLLYFETTDQKANFEKYIDINYKQTGYSEETKSENIYNFKFDQRRLWDSVRQMWLISMGYTEDYIADHDKWIKENPDRPYIASGISSRGVGHVVIYKGGKMIHDPHPSNEGLVKIDYFFYLRKIEGDYEFDRYYIKIETNERTDCH